jgi:hypothetical protein
VLRPHDNNRSFILYEPGTCIQTSSYNKSNIKHYDRKHAHVIKIIFEHPANRRNALTVESGAPPVKLSAEVRTASGTDRYTVWTSYITRLQLMLETKSIVLHALLAPLQKVYIHTLKFSVCSTILLGVRKNFSLYKVCMGHDKSPEVEWRDGRVAMHMRTMLLLNTIPFHVYWPTSSHPRVVCFWMFLDVFGCN